MFYPLQVAGYGDPSSLNTGTRLTVVPHSEMGGGGFFAIGPISISFVLRPLTFILISFDCCTSSLQQVSISLLPDLAINSDSVVSSTNLCIIHETLRLSTRVMSINGPRYDPWGMPASITSHSDIMSPILTHWRRWCKNEHIHRMICGRSNSINLATRTLWSTWSNALAKKSTKTTWTDLPSSMALCQWCKMSTRACVVEWPFNTPYWCLSSLSSILSNIHEPMKDSNSLLNVAVSEIGRRSTSISWGRWTFGTGITLASFHWAGTMLSWIEALKIAHTGPESWKQKSRRTQLGRPSGPGALWILKWLNFLSMADRSMMNSLNRRLEGRNVVCSDSWLFKVK